MISIFAAMINFLLSPAFSWFPLLVKVHFGGVALHLGWANSVFGIGVIVGGLVLGVWVGFRRRIDTSLTGVVGIGTGTLALGTSPSDIYLIALVAMLIIGISLPIANDAIGAIMQATVEPEFQGRVFALIGSLAGAMTPNGLAMAGPISIG